MGRGRVVCVSPKPGSCADESRLNGEPQAVLSCPTLTHLSPKSLMPSLKGQGPAPFWQGVGGVNPRCPRQPNNTGPGSGESRQGTGINTVSQAFLGFSSPHPPRGLGFCGGGACITATPGGHLCPIYLIFTHPRCLCSTCEY